MTATLQTKVKEMFSNDTSFQHFRLSGSYKQRKKIVQEHSIIEFKIKFMSYDPKLEESSLEVTKKHIEWLHSKQKIKNKNYEGNRPDYRTS